MLSSYLLAVTMLATGNTSGPGKITDNVRKVTMPCSRNALQSITLETHTLIVIWMWVSVLPCHVSTKSSQPSILFRLADAPSLQIPYPPKLQQHTGAFRKLTQILCFYLNSCNYWPLVRSSASSSILSNRMGLGSPFVRLIQMWVRVVNQLFSRYLKIIWTGIINIILYLYYSSHWLLSPKELVCSLRLRPF